MQHWPAAVCVLAVLGLLTGCDQLPGKPTAQHRWMAPSQVVDFSQLYAHNCAGCHGADGRLGAALPLHDPLYLALVSTDTLRQVIAQGVPNTAMPAFGQQAGGSLTEQQIAVLVEGMRAQWGGPNAVKDVALPPYSLQDASANGSGPGDPQRGAVAYQTYCAQCHGTDGRGGPKAGSVVDPNFLALVSDQSLRTTVIIGRPDFGKPDWRANLPGQPMTPQDISDVVAWLAGPRRSTLASHGPSSDVKTANDHKVDQAQEAPKP